VTSGHQGISLEFRRRRMGPGSLRSVLGDGLDLHKTGTVGGEEQTSCVKLQKKQQLIATSRGGAWAIVVGLWKCVVNMGGPVGRGENCERDVFGTERGTGKGKVAQNSSDSVTTESEWPSSKRQVNIDEVGLGQFGFANTKVSARSRA